MTKYLEEFPGLVHFIFIDRTANRVTAPSINTDSENIYNWRDPAHYIKQGIWDGWNYVQTFLVQGKVTIGWLSQVVIISRSDERPLLYQ